jgi:hypothetical protein
MEEQRFSSGMGEVWLFLRIGNPKFFEGEKYMRRWATTRRALATLGRWDHSQVNYALL